jgi:hypothetical protein
MTSLQGRALIFPRWEMGMGHPLDWAGSLWRAYALCFTQKITTKKIKQGNIKVIPHVPGVPVGMQ